jgi:hypothetical protein
MARAPRGDVSTLPLLPALTRTLPSPLAARGLLVSSAAAAVIAAAAAATRSSSSSSSPSSSPPPPPPPTAPDPSEGPARYGRAVSAGLRACARESHAYGRCAAGFLPDAAPKGACEREFSALRRCFLAASGLDAWRRKRAEADGDAVDVDADAAELSGRPDWNA